MLQSSEFSDNGNIYKGESFRNTLPSRNMLTEASFIQLFINNEFVAAKSGKTFPTINPATGEKICDIAEADKVR